MTLIQWVPFQPRPWSIYCLSYVANGIKLNRRHNIQVMEQNQPDRPKSQTMPCTNKSANSIESIHQSVLVLIKRINCKKWANPRWVDSLHYLSNQHQSQLKTPAQLTSTGCARLHFHQTALKFRIVVWCQKWFHRFLRGSFKSRRCYRYSWNKKE